MPDNDFKKETEDFFDDFHSGDKVLFNLTELDKYLMKNYYLNISEFLLDEIKRYNNISEKSKILDIGCGSGEYLIFLNNNFKKGRYYGIDISQSAIDQAINNLKKNKFNFFGDPYLRDFTYKVNAENFEFSKTNGTDLPFQKNYFDIVYILMTLHHTYKYESLIKEAHRVLKNDGILVIVDLKGQSEITKIFMKTIFRTIPKFLTKKIFKNDLVLENGKIPFRSDVSFDEIKRITNKISGFKVIKSQTHYLLTGYFILLLNTFYSDILFLIVKPFLFFVIILDQKLSSIFKNSCGCYAIIIKKSK